MNFTHLHVHTAFSLLDGASKIPSLIARVKQLGMNSIAITDHGNMYGVLDFYKEALKQDVKPIIGCEVYLAPKSRFERKDFNGRKYFHLILLAKNNIGYQNLTRLVSYANLDGYYYKPRIDKELLRKYHDGLICLSACVSGEIPVALINDNYELASKLTDEYIDIFGRENFFLEIQDHGLKAEEKVRAGILKLSREKNIPMVATNDSHYINRDDSEFHDVLLCIQTTKTIDSPHRLKFNSDDYYLKSPQEMADLFADYLDAVQNSNRIADMCNVSINFDEFHLPNFSMPTEFQSPKSYLRYLCESNLNSKYPQLTQKIQQRLDYELKTINQMGFDEYFLIVQDFIHWAKSEKIPVGPGRGSAAGSIVAYLLGITEIEPMKYNLLFERFLNPARVSMPDIDVDFCYIRRDEVIDYVRRKYGVDHVAQIATFGTFAAKAAIRDVGKVFNMSVAQTNKITRFILNAPNVTIDQSLENSREFSALYDNDPDVRKVVDIAKKIEGMPRHVSTHAAGVVISKTSLLDIVPVQSAEISSKYSMLNQSKMDLVTQYDKDQIEKLGLLKMDFLGLRTLTFIDDAIKNIAVNRGIRIDIDKIPLDDPITSKMLCDGKTSAVFQMESTGMTSLVVKFQPKHFEDLIPLIALYRPGPLGSGMIDDFVNRRRNIEPIEYLHPKLEPILKDTYGIILYQEQVMQIVQVLAGFSLEQADLFRRAIGKKKADILLAQRNNFIQGCLANGVSVSLAQTIFDLLEKFADYGFNKSHSVAYALISWQTAFLKANYPAEYMSAVLTNISDTDRVGIYVDNARKMSLRILPPDVNSSFEFFSVANDSSIRFGLFAVKGVGMVAASHLVQTRKSSGKFTSLLDFCKRVDLKIFPKHAVESLIKAGAFDSIEKNRALLLEILDAAITEAFRYQSEKNSGRMNLFGEEELEIAAEIKMPNVQPASPSLIRAWEKESLGFFMSNPFERFGKEFDGLDSIRSVLDGNFNDGMKIRIVGILSSMKNVRTKKNEMMMFGTISDAYDSIDVTIFPATYEKYKEMLVIGSTLVFQCSVSSKNDEVNLIITSIWAADSYRRTIYLKMDSDEIRKICEANPGNIPVTSVNRKYPAVSENVIPLLKDLIGAEQFIWI